MTPVERLVASGVIDGEIVRPGVPTPTVPDAAQALGVEERQILKSLLFANREGSNVLAIALGPDRVSVEKLAAVSGLDGLRLAKPAFVEGRTGYPVGAMPPVGHEPPLDVIVDQRVAALEVVYGGGGQVDTLLRIRPAEILRHTGAAVADIVM